MRKGQVVALVCALLATGASGAGAQSASRHVTAADKASPRVRLSSSLSAAKAYVRHMRGREREAIKDAQRLVELGIKPASRGSIDIYAALSQKHLQEVMDLLNEGTAHAQSNPHLENARARQSEALHAAQVLVNEATQGKSSTSTLSERANDVVVAAEGALALLTAPTAADFWIAP